MSKTIWKLQRPLFASDEGGYREVMAYPEDRTRLAIIIMPTEDIHLIFEEAEKIYIYGEVKRDNLVVDYKLPEEDWPEW